MTLLCNYCIVLVVMYYSNFHKKALGYFIYHCKFMKFVVYLTAVSAANYIASYRGIINV